MRQMIQHPIALALVGLTASPALAAGGGESNLFAGSLYQSAAAIIAFAIVFFLLKKKAWGPIISGLQDRENKIREDLASAEKARDEATAKTEELDAKLAEAHAEVRSIIDQARADAESLRSKRVGEIESEIQQLRERATGEIESAKQQAVQDLYAKSATLAVAVAEKILNRQIDASDTQTLVDQSLAELDKLNDAG